MKLTDRSFDIIKYKEQSFNVDLAFDVVLRSFELLDDNFYNDSEKYLILFEMFFPNGKEEIPDDFQFDDIKNLVDAVFKDCLKSESESNGNSGKRLYDLVQDANYIYASFLQDYGMDLFEMHGRLHWKKFVALLGGLSEKTKFVEVIKIRKMKVPMPTKHNAEERKQILELKRTYALKAEYSEEEIKAADNKLSAISKHLKKSYENKYTKRK